MATVNQGIIVSGGDTAVFSNATVSLFTTASKEYAELVIVTDSVTGLVNLTIGSSVFIISGPSASGIPSSQYKFVIPPGKAVSAYAPPGIQTSICWTLFKNV